MAEYTFAGRLAFSRGSREEIDIASLKNMIPGCVFVEKTGEDLDRAGVDYIATLRGGAEILIDAKAREKGCNRWWKSGPELALEVWSVRPNKKTPGGRAGWTLNESKNTDLILFTFDPADTSECFLVPFQHLRMAFKKHYRRWKKQYRTGNQSSGRWESQCLFVPASIVLSAIEEEFRQELFYRTSSTA